MADKMTPQQRHKCMSHIRSKDTRPEMLVRRFLWRNGIRYRLYVKSLPGTPDIVIRRLRIAIFINGCFWHGHSCQKRLPASNKKFWFNKISNNQQRDIRNKQLLEADGWMVIVIWECQLSARCADETLNKLLNTISLIERTCQPNKLRTAYISNFDHGYDYSIAAEDEVPYGPSSTDIHDK